MGKRKANRASPERVSGLTGERDRSEAMETLARAFSGVDRMERHMGRGLWRGDTFDPEHTRITVARGRVVSAVVMGPRTIRFGPARVPAMTLGPVGTHDHYRKRGYGAAAMNDASEYMKRNGILVAYLQGIPDFYYRFGYYPFTAPSDAKIERNAAKKASRPGKLRAMRRTDLHAVRRIYDEATAGRLCSAERDDRVWDWLWNCGRRTWMFESPRVIVDMRGRLHGYVTLWRQNELRTGEIVVRQNEKSCRVALGALVREAKRRELKEMVVRLPWDDALMCLLRQYAGAEFRLYPHSTGGALMKVVDFPGLMAALEPLFDARWKAARTSLCNVRFNIVSEIGSVGLDAGRGGVRVGAASRKGSRVHVPQRWLSGLVTGYYTPRDVAPRQGARIPGSLMPAVNILFPAAWPFAYQGDNY